MKRITLGLALAAFAGGAAAGDLAEPRYYESDDFSARAVYRVDFGGTRGYEQSLGLRLDSVRAEAAGAPALFSASFRGDGLAALSLTGVDLRGAALASNQSEGGGFFGSMTTAQLVALGVTVVTFGLVAIDVGDGESDAIGTGGS